MVAAIEHIRPSDVAPFDMVDEGVFVREVTFWTTGGVEAIVATCTLKCEEYDGRCLVGPSWGAPEQRVLKGTVDIARGIEPRVEGCLGLARCHRQP